MKYNTVSTAYAKSLYQLGKEKSVAVTEDLMKLDETIKANEYFESVLFMDVFTMEEKIGVVEAVIHRLNLHSLIKSFLIFLIREKRIHIFPLVFKDIIGIDDHEKGVLRGTLEGAEGKIDAASLEKIKNYLEKELNKKVHLDYVKKSEMVAGYRITVEDFQLDASLDKQLDRLRQGNLLNN